MKDCLIKKKKERIVYLKCGVVERKGETHMLIHSLTAREGPLQIEEPGTPSGSPRWVTGGSALGHLPLLPQVH